MPKVIDAPARRSGTRTAPAHRTFSDEYVKECADALLAMEPGQTLALDEYATGHRVPASGKYEGQTRPGDGVASSTAQAIRARIEERYKRLDRRVKTSVLHPDDPKAEDAQWIPLLGVSKDKRRDKAEEQPAEQ